MQLLLQNKKANKHIAARKRRMLQQKCWAAKAMKQQQPLVQLIICPSCENGLPLNWECHYCLHCGFELGIEQGQPPKKQRRFS